jgi:E3 ubiquitin-protein ligase BRE1
LFTRFERKRIEEELTILNMRASRANANNDNRHLVEKLQDEIDEYKAILKCSVCHNRSKEVSASPTLFFAFKL